MSVPPELVAAAGAGVGEARLDASIVGIFICGKGACVGGTWGAWGVCVGTCCCRLANGLVELDAEECKAGVGVSDWNGLALAAFAIVVAVAVVGSAVTSGSVVVAHAVDGCL